MSRLLANWSVCEHPACGECPKCRACIVVDDLGHEDGGTMMPCPRNWTPKPPQGCSKDYPEIPLHRDTTGDIIAVAQEG